jgi:hypothetical protein
MSDREQPDTVPPPAGEEDAYSAATKVGAMPPELLASLRAEGLLPEEGSAREERRTPAPSSALGPRPARVVPPRSADDVPVLYSEPPPSRGPSFASSVPPPVHGGAAGGAAPLPAPPPIPSALQVPDPGAVLETPTAFAPPSTPSVPADARELARSSTDDDSAEIRAFGGRSRGRMAVVLVGGLVVLVLVAFAMALLSQRR